jgi:hypothetical protein
LGEDTAHLADSGAHRSSGSSSRIPPPSPKLNTWPSAAQTLARTPSCSASSEQGGRAR